MRPYLPYLAVAACALAVGNLLPSVRPFVVEARSAPATASLAASVPSPEAHAWPADVLALRERLDAGPAAAEAAELIGRLGILGGPPDIERLDPYLEHPSYSLRLEAAGALGRIGSDRALDRLSVLALGSDDDLATAAIQGLGLSPERRATATLAEVIRGPQEWRRNTAYAALATQGGAAARSLLHSAFRSARPGDAWVVAQALVAMGGAPELRLLVAEATRPASPRREAALTALAAAGDPRVDGMLIDLARDTSGTHRQAVIGALGGVRDPEVAEVLREALHAGQALRDTALSVLATNRAEGSFDVLVEAIDLVGPHDAWLICDALGRRPEPQALDILAVLAQEHGPLGDAALQTLAARSDPRAGEVLLARFDTTGQLPPEHAYRFLATHGGEEGWSLLEEVLTDGSDNQRSAVLYALGERADEDAVARLIDVAQSEPGWVGQSALQALEGIGELAHEPLRALLVERLDEAGLQDLEATASTLARIGGDGAFDALASRLDTASEMERGALVRALGQMDDPEARAALRSRMDSEDPAVRGEVFHAMLYAPHGVDAETVALGLDDPDASIRATATSMIASSGLPDSRDRLLDLSADDDPSVRSSAMAGLAELGGPEAEAVLTAALEDPEASQQALWGLQSLGTPSAREALREVAANGDDAMRAAALGTLEQDRSPEALELLTAALTDPDAGVAGTAVAALSARGGRDAAEAVAAAMLEADDEDLAEQMAWALQSMGGPIAREHAGLIEELTHRPRGDEPFLDDGFGLDGLPPEFFQEPRFPEGDVPPF